MALTYIKTSGLDPNSTFTFANVSLSGNIIPESNNVSTLGDPTHVFKDVYIGPGSLYIDGSKVLEASGSDIIVTADINQNLRVVTSGSGDIELDPTGTGVVALKGPLQFEAGTQATSSDGNPIHFSNPIAVNSITSSTTNSDLAFSGNGTGGVKVNDNLTVTGDLTIQGTTGNLSVTTLVVQDNIIDISAETTGAPSANAGLRVIRGDDPSVQLRWNEISDIWQMTNDGTAYLDIVGKDSAGNVALGNITATSLSGTLTTSAQPNITSTGTLTSVTVSGLITATAGGIKVGNIQDTTGTNTIQVSSGTTGIIGNLEVGTGGAGNVTATYFIGNGSQLTGLPESYSNANVATYLPTYTGNLSPSNLVVSTSANLGDIGNVTITGGTNGQVLSTNGTGVLSWADQASGGSGGGTAITVDNFTGDGTTSSFTLSVAPATVNNVIVNYNGTLVSRASYSILGTTLSLGSAPALNSKIEVSTISGLSAGSATFNTRTYTGDGTDVTYVVTNGSTASTVLVTLNGSMKTPITDYTISGTVLTFATAPGAGVNIQIRELGVVVGTNSVNINTTAFRAQAMTMGIIFGR